MPDHLTTDCPHCDTALAPERIAPGVWLCPCCASTWRTDTAPDAAPAGPAPDPPAGRTEAR